MLIYRPILHDPCRPENLSLEATALASRNSIWFRLSQKSIDKIPIIV